MKKIATLLLVLLLLPGLINTRAASTPMPIIVKEYINATIVTDGSGYYCGPWNVTGYIIVLNNNTGETISDIWVPIDTTATGFTLSLSNVTYKPDYAYVTFGTPPTYVQNENSGVNNFMHITQLKSGDKVTVKYVKYYNNVCPPLLLNESMNPSKIVNGVNTTVNVTLTVTNNIGSDVYVKVRKILSSDNGKEGWQNVTGNPKFTYSPGTTSPGKAGYSTDKKEFYWTGDGSWPDGWFTLLKDQTGKTSFNISGKPDLSEVGGTKKIPLGTVYLYFYMPHTYTGLKIGKVFAVGNADVEVKKEQDTNNPSTWKETLVFYDTSGVFKYDLFNTTLWATEGDTPDSASISGSRNSQQTFNITQLLPSGSYTYGPFSFTYSGVPKIWGLAKFRISNDQNNGWWNYTNATTITDSSGLSYFRVIEEIWAVNGYLVKARKEIRANATTGCYIIGISLSNIGQWMSPYVEMYDVVPSGFNPSPTSTEGNMVFKPLEMLAQDANSASPPDFSLKHISAEYTGYVWKSYPLPAPQLGFAEYFKGTGWSNNKNITVTLASGATKVLTVYPVDTDTINVNGTDYDENSNITIDTTTFKVTFVDDNLTSPTSGGYVVVSAYGYYPNLKMKVFNPVFVKYAVCGTGNYNATNLFIVGVDPRNTLDALAVSAPEARMSYGTSNFEIVFVIAAIAASIIAVRKR
ncbi:MAG: hypothetical protein ACUX7D_00510 [Candidatus Methanodesulfokora washburnensis]|jgi:hypothetical protein